MITNISPLPWKEKLSKNKRKYIICNNNNKIIINDVNHLVDALYIEECCNHMPKAIELLKSTASLPGSEIYNFLKQLE